MIDKIITKYKAWLHEREKKIHFNGPCSDFVPHILFSRSATRLANTLSLVSEPSLILRPSNTAINSEVSNDQI